MNLTQLKLKIRSKMHDDTYQSYVAVAQELYGDLTKDNCEKWHLTLYKLEHSSMSIQEVKTEMLSRSGD